MALAAAAVSKPIALGAKPVSVLVPRPVARAGSPAHCYVVVSGLSAAAPVGAQYAVMVDGVSAGTISFYDATGVAADKTAPLSFEVPARSCGHTASVTLKPVGSPNPAAAPSVGSISLVAQ